MNKIFMLLSVIVIIGLMKTVFYSENKSYKMYPEALAPIDNTFQVYFEIKNFKDKGNIFLNGANSGLMLENGQVIPSQKYLSAGRYDLEIMVDGRSIGKVQISLAKKSSVICEMHTNGKLSCNVLPGRN